MAAPSTSSRVGPRCGSRAARSASSAPAWRRVSPTQGSASSNCIRSRAADLLELAQIAQAPLLLVQFQDLLGGHPQGLQLTDLIAQQVEAGGAVGALGLEVAQQLGRGPDSARTELGHRPGQVDMAAVGVEQVALGRGAQQGLVGVLAVDVHQALAELLELGAWWRGGR